MVCGEQGFKLSRFLGKFKGICQLAQTFSLTTGKHHKVVGVSNEPGFGPVRRCGGSVNGLVEPVQIHVRYERREDSALRRSLLIGSRRPFFALFLYSCRQPEAEQTQSRRLRVNANMLARRESREETRR